MGLFRRGSKRLPPHEWPLPLVAQQIVAAYVTDPDGHEPRGAAVFHLDPELLPDDFEEIVREAVEEDGEEFTGTSEWMVFKLEFEEDDRVALFMDGDATAVIR